MVSAHTSALSSENSHDETTRRERHPAAWRETLRWLESRPVRELRELARYRGASSHITRKTELVAELVGLLADPENVRKALAALHPNEMATLELIYLLMPNGNVQRQRLQKALLAWYGPAVAQDVAQYLDRLARQGLLFRQNTQDGSLSLWLPKAVSACLTSLSKEITLSALDQDKGLVTHQDVVLEEVSALVLLRAVNEAWRYFRTHQVRLQSGRADFEPEKPFSMAERAAPLEAGITPRWHKGVGADFTERLYAAVPLPIPELRESDIQELAKATGYGTRAVDFFYHLLLDLGLITRSGEFVQVNELAMKRYQKHGDMQRLQALTSAWLAMESWAEFGLVLERAEDLTMRYVCSDDLESKMAAYRDIRHLRQFTARLLSLLEQDRWYDLEALLEVIQQICPDSSSLQELFGATSARWWFASTKRPSLALGEIVEWRQGYGNLFVAFLIGPLTWLGCLTTAYVADRPIAVRMTGLGKHLLCSYSQMPLGSGDMRPMTVGGDLTVHIQLGRVDAQVHDFLSEFAELVDAESDAFRYRITPSQINQALENGISGEEIISFLERVSGSSLPDAARQTLEQWTASYGMVRLYENLTVIEFADDYALQELLNTTSLAQHIVCQLSPRWVVIEADTMNALMAEMVRKGYTPKIEEALS